jgi:hypothetical protein
MTTPVPTVSAELKAVLRQVKLGRCLDTLPERLALAKQRSMGHAEFLELVMSDEVTRRETTSAALRSKSAGLDPDMCLEQWDETTKVSFDHQVWDELCSLRCQRSSRSPHRRPSEFPRYGHEPPQVWPRNSPPSQRFICSRASPPCRSLRPVSGSTLRPFGRRERGAIAGRPMQLRGSAA